MMQEFNPIDQKGVGQAGNDTKSPVAFPQLACLRARHFQPVGSTVGALPLEFNSATVIGMPYVLISPNSVS